jgi:outer membrane lipoprotein
MREASMMTRMVFTAMIVCAEILAAGCAKSAHQTGQDQLQRLVPSDVLSQVDDTVSFNELRADPQQYTGRTVIISGLALQSKRVKDGTEIEILQVPTERGLSPSDRKAKSEGRFLAVQSNGFLDPAVIEKDAPLTVVGEVKGVRTKALDEGEYHYPVLDVKQLIDWNDIASRDRDRYWNDDDLGYYGRYSGYYGPWSSWYYGFGSPFSGPYGLYPYSYYGPYYAFPRGYSAPAPAPPPPSATPRLFHRE